MRLSKIPAGEKVSHHFLVKLNGKETSLQWARVSAMPYNRVWPGKQRQLEQTEEASILNFCMNEPTMVELTAEKDFDEVVVRPLSKGIKPCVNGRKISFTIERAGQYTVELDGHHNALHIFANPERDFSVLEGAKDVLYFGAGVYDAGLIELTSGQTLYIDQDAVVYGYVRAIHAKNIKILGNGILDGSKQLRSGDTILVPKDMSRRNPDHDNYNPLVKKKPVKGLEDPAQGTDILADEERFRAYLKEVKMLGSCVQLYGCEGVELNGVILRDSVGFTCIIANGENVVVDNIKLIGMWRFNSDGIDLFNCRNVIVRNSFLRNFDDCVVLKGIIGFDTWSMENILIEDCVLWCDWGKSLEIGAETCAPAYRNIIFRNCDCIHNANVALDVESSDYAHVNGVSFENICVEFSKHERYWKMQSSDDAPFDSGYGIAALFRVNFGGTYYSCEKQKGRIENVTFKNIRVFSDSPQPIYAAITGFDREHVIKNVVVEGVSVNGEKVDDPSFVAINEFVEGFKFL